ETILFDAYDEEEGAYTIEIHNDILIGAMYNLKPNAKFDNTYFALLLSVGVLADGGTIICETKEYIENFNPEQIIEYQIEQQLKMQLGIDIDADIDLATITDDQELYRQTEVIVQDIIKERYGVNIDELVTQKEYQEFATDAVIKELEMYYGIENLGEATTAEALKQIFIEEIKRNLSIKRITKEYWQKTKEAVKEFFSTSYSFEKGMYDLKEFGNKVKIYADFSNKVLNANIDLSQISIIPVFNGDFEGNYSYTPMHNSFLEYDLSGMENIQDVMNLTVESYLNAYGNKLLSKDVEIERNGLILDIDADIDVGGDGFGEAGYALKDNNGKDIIKFYGNTGADLSATINMSLHINGEELKIQFPCEEKGIHFDNNQDINSIKANWKEINNKLSSFGKLDENNAVKLGLILHNVADFYAHSNYIEK
ncbi:MAG: hypothetical protein MI740_15665, partial [Halanaerobiales bacterium]|nr:hypothetical protein [Halanaerobiales bacterium]